jgi:microcystin-dependent protein
MSYTISYTDSVNKGTITVEDGTLNQDTSLQIPGRNSTSYGTAIGENFLHLLENFASANAPARPVEGQLWYDNTDGVDQLKIYDGTNWVASGGLKKASSEPAVANSNAGDLWVNTEAQQLYLFTGSGWVLVGPEFSDGLLTGTQASSIVGTDDLTYNVLSIKIQDQIIAIIAKQAFIPKVAIPGFRTGLSAGFNLSDTPLVGSEAVKYFGTAEKAEALVIGDTTIPANNFLRGDLASTTTEQLTIQNNNGIKIGTEGQLSFNVDSNNSGVIQQNREGSTIDIKLISGSDNPTVIRVDSEGFVGINNVAPEDELDVKGDVRINTREGFPDSGVLRVDSTKNATAENTGSIQTLGGISVSQNAYIAGAAQIEGIITSGSNIVPKENSLYNVGSLTAQWDNVYANTFIGNLQGNVSGTVSGRAGSADRLASATTFAVSGDVTNNSFEFDGQTGGTSKTFNIQIANSFISNKDVIYDAGNADELLLNVTSGTTGVYRITKRNFLKTIPLLPAGVLMPYGAGNAPSGWLLCDGTVVRKSDYTELWNAIGHNFLDASLLDDAGVNTFALPDMRGRMPLGLDNIGGSPANRVTNAAADAIGGNLGSETKQIDVINLPEHEHDMEGDSGTQYYATRVGEGQPADDAAITLTVEPGLGGTQGLASSGGIKTTNTLGQGLDVMNPYLALNYIIYTGAG